MAFTKYIISLLLIPTLLCPTLSAQQKKFREKASGEKVLPTEETRPDDRNKEDYLLEGIRYYNMRNPELAKANFLKLLEKDPSNDAAYFYLSNISLMTQDLVSGEVLLKKALALDSANYWYNDLLARLYLRTGRTEEAIKTYEKLISLHPKKTDIYYALADLYMNKQDIGNSVRTLDKIERIAGKSEAVGLARFNLYRIQQDWEGALKYLIEFDKEFQSARIETLIGDMYADRYRDTLAMKYYARALETEPSYAPAQFGQAEIHRMHREYNLFFEKVTPFIKSPYVNPQMKQEYLTQLLQSPQFIQNFKPQVDTLMADLETAHPKDSTTMMLIAAYHNEFGDKEKSKKILQDNYRQHPDSFSAAFQYLTYIYYLENWEELESEAGKILEKFPGNTDFLQLTGIAQYQTGRPEQAIKTYRQIEAVALPQNDTATLLTAYAMLGDLSHETNRSGQSYAYYKKALEINPNHNPVLNNYAYYLALENKNLKKAYEMSKKTVESEPDNPTYLDTFGWILYLMDRCEEAKTYFKHAMLYGGKENADVLDHYAEVLYKLKEYDLAFIYWEQAAALDKSMGIEEKVRERKAQMKK